MQFQHPASYLIKKCKPRGNFSSALKETVLSKDGEVKYFISPPFLSPAPVRNFIMVLTVGGDEDDADVFDGDDDDDLYIMVKCVCVCVSVTKK